VKRHPTTFLLGVIDSGTRYTHEDLDGNIWVNRGQKIIMGMDDLTSPR